MYNELYYDGFNWQARDMTEASKEMRTIQIMGLPFDEVEFTEGQLAQYMNDFMARNLLSDTGNRRPIRHC